MVDRAYFYSDATEQTSVVTSCTRQEDGTFHVQLASTLFHPQGGGQPSDRGTISEVEVLGVHQDQGEIVHVTRDEVPLGEVAVKVDAEWRSLLARYHSAGHLIAAAGERYGWRGVKGNHRPGEGRVVFDPIGQTQPITEEALLLDVQALIGQDMERAMTEQSGMRMVTWGRLDATACGGTHVSRTSQVGELKIVKVKEKKGQLSVQYELA